MIPSTNRASARLSAMLLGLSFAAAMPAQGITLSATAPITALAGSLPAATLPAGPMPAGGNLIAGTLGQVSVLTWASHADQAVMYGSFSLFSEPPLRRRCPCPVAT